MSSENDINEKLNEKEVNIHAGTENLFTDDAVDPVHRNKARILSDAIRDISMGRYQWGLFVVTGFGWLADNLWPIVTGLILPPVLNEFAFCAAGPFLKLGQNIGLGCRVRRLGAQIERFVTYYLATRGTDFGDGSLYITYRNVHARHVRSFFSVDEVRFETKQVILSVIGVPGALLAGYMVELPLFGRRGTLAISTALTGAFILTSTTACTSNALLGWNCAYSFTSNMMYEILYAITLDLFPTKDRVTGNAIVAAANRVFGIMALIVALYMDLTTLVPIFIAGAIFVVSGFIALLLPFELRG
ncbi:hypothetical protein DXG01_006262 [Tephrocybe rancida]|nr:hypothetical protein DXG01_006262 [Tephrocybe rancida]